MDNETEKSWKAQLNQKLHSSPWLHGYACVYVLILSWEDGNISFHNEGLLLGDFFQKQLNYTVFQYAIPSSQSYLELQGYITRSALSLAEEAKQKNGSPLLIIHYGGHGDRNNDRGKGEQKLSVWAAHDQGEPTLEWSGIQEGLKYIDIDILLLLDCCYAAQAGRSREEKSARIELLAAAAMGTQTPLPGTRSFTMALIRVMQSFLSGEGRVKITDLHTKLVSREADLWTTPVYVKLSPGNFSIVLEPLKEREDIVEEDSGSVIQLLIRTRQNLQKANADDIAAWLTRDVPKGIISLKVADIMDNTAQLHTLVTKATQKDGPIANALDQPALEVILIAWNDLIALVEQYNLSHQKLLESDHFTQNMSLIQQRAQDFLSVLNDRNNAILETTRTNLMNSSFLNLEAVDEETIEFLGLVDQLKLREMVRSNELDDKEVDITISHKIQRNVLLEFKTYDTYTNPQLLPELTARVEGLAGILRAPKDESFCSLKCLNWQHERLDYRFIFEFEIPAVYGAAVGTYHSLQSLIHEATGPGRPTLDDRFRMANLLAKAVQAWHSVGWVHQGISSPNILFFPLKYNGRMDYRNPFLQGFQFSRPKCDPSIGITDMDIASDVYRHPDRQGPKRRGHMKTHDFYSLGVVLLEIGLWQSAFKMVGIKATQILKTEEVQRRLLKSAQRLGHYAGASYQTAVETCLKGDFGVDLDDLNESHLARSFQKNVIVKLSNGVKGD